MILSVTRRNTSRHTGCWKTTAWMATHRSGPLPQCLPTSACHGSLQAASPSSPQVLALGGPPKAQPPKVFLPGFNQPHALVSEIMPPPAYPPSNAHTLKCPSEAKFAFLHSLSLTLSGSWFREQQCLQQSSFPYSHPSWPHGMPGKSYKRKKRRKRRRKRNK